jgi:hypothetical protein
LKVVENALAFVLASPWMERVVLQVEVVPALNWINALVIVAP